MLENSETWPGFPAVSLLDYLVPYNDPTAGLVPLYFAQFMKLDLRNMHLDHYTDWLCINMAESTLRIQLNDYWSSVLH